MRIALRVPQIFRTDPDPDLDSGPAVGFGRVGGRGRLITGTRARVWAFTVMAGVAIVLHAHGADLVTASGVVVALGAAATQLTTPIPVTSARAASTAPTAS